MSALVEKQTEFFRKLRDAHCYRHMELEFLYAAAPVLCGAKSATLLPLHDDCRAAWAVRQHALQKATGLNAREIVSGRGTVLLFLYDEAALGQILQNEKNAALLTGYGYSAGCSTGEALAHLQHRFLTAHFPHEIGVLLGYPIEDVWGFITNKGKDFICCRHWKVYHDLDRAQEMFRRIDEAHEYAISLLCDPLPIHIAARLLKAA